MKHFLTLSAAVIICLTSLAQTAPGWSRGQQLLQQSYEECLNRASQALTSLGYRIDYAQGSFRVGIKNTHTATINCLPAPSGTHIIIMVASNGDGGGLERQCLQTLMDNPNTSTPCSNSTNTNTNTSQTIQGDWNTQPNYLHGSVGQRFTIHLPPGGTASGRIWGSNIYTDDSSIGTCAVHAGLINFRDGGTVTIEIRPGLQSYQTTTQNGVTSNSYGSWSGSFVFIR